jgi:hypothetical protein
MRTATSVTEGKDINDHDKDGTRPSSRIALFIRKDVAAVNGFGWKKPRVFLTFA